MKNIFLIFIFLISTKCFPQNLKCNDFIEGVFKGSSTQFPEVEWEIKRFSNSQVERLTKVPQEYIDMGLPMDSVFGKFTRIEKCIFKFEYDGKKMYLDKYQKEMNQSVGIIVKIEKIKERCFYYTSKTIVDNKEMVLDGKLCKN